MLFSVGVQGDHTTARRRCAARPGDRGGVGGMVQLVAGEERCRQAAPALRLATSRPHDRARDRAKRCVLRAVAPAPGAQVGRRPAAVGRARARAQHQHARKRLASVTVTAAS